MREDPDNHGGLLDGSDDLQVAATLRAVFEVDIEHAFEQPRPAHARRCFMRVVGRIIDGFLRWARHDRGAQPGIGCEHAVKTDQMQARTRHQRGQALHDFQRRHLDVRGAVTPGAFELQHDITRAIALEPFVGDRRAGDIAAQPFDLLALMRATAYPGMQAEACPEPVEGPCASAHRVTVFLSSRPGTVRRLGTFCPARGPSAMR